MKILWDYERQQLWEELSDETSPLRRCMTSEIDCSFQTFWKHLLSVPQTKKQTTLSDSLLQDTSTYDKKKHETKELEDQGPALIFYTHDQNLSLFGK